MKIAVSACLLGENCKYSGGNNRSERLLSELAKQMCIRDSHIVGASRLPSCDA